MVRLEARFAKAQFPTVGKRRGGYKNRTRKGRSSAKEAKGHLCFAIYRRKEGEGIKERTVALFFGMRFGALSVHSGREERNDFLKCVFFCVGVPPSARRFQVASFNFRE